MDCIFHCSGGIRVKLIYFLWFAVSHWLLVYVCYLGSGRIAFEFRFFLSFGSIFVFSGYVECRLEIEVGIGKDGWIL